MEMNCPQCHSENPVDSSFCSRCGSKLSDGDKNRSVTPSSPAEPQDLARGTILVNQYTIIEELGRGGMGVVFRARDNKLGRDVAIKVLPEEFSSDRERLTRFEREAKMLASLNHPAIATIYGLEQSESRHFIVLELVEGRDLSEILAKAVPPIPEALDICCQIAHALESAHDKGVVHRDLKPANIKITPEGKVKVLDFGLAKPAPSQPDISSKTLTSDHTVPGMILGTAAYMSPEQARGKTVDRRTDIWSFGCILWEILTGQSLFSGETVSDTLAKVLESAPPWDDLPADLPPGVRRVLDRSLRKDPAHRLRNIGDVVFDLEASSVAEEAKAGIPEKRKRPTRLIWMVGSAALVIGLAAGMFLQSRNPAEIPEPILRLSLLSRNRLLPRIGSAGGPPAVSPDGSRVAFAAMEEGQEQKIYIQDLNSYLARPITGTEGGSYPFWSPDGEWLAFFGAGNLKKIPSSGGAAQVLASAPLGRGGAWHPDGFILFAQVIGIPILRVDANGGTPEPVTEMEPSDKWDTHRSPCFLPDGRRFLYFARSSEAPDLNGVFMAELDSKERKRILSVQSHICFAPPNYVIHSKDRVLYAQAIDLDSGEPVGQPLTIADRVIGSLINAQPDFSAAANGTVVFRDWESVPAVRFFWADRKGNIISEVTSDGIRTEDLGISLSSDSNRLLMSLGEEDSDCSNLWLLHLETGTLTRLTSERRLDFLPVWNPGGKEVAFSVLPVGGGIPRIHRIPASATEASVELEGPEGRMLVDSWSPDGQYIIYHDVVGGQTDLIALPINGGPSVPIANSRFNESTGKLSPEGNWMAFLTNESGGSELYVQDFPSASRKWRISMSGAVDLAWSADGKELYYLTPDKWIMALPIAGSDSFENPQAQRLFALPEASRSLSNVRLLVSSDGRRFLFPRPEESSSRSPIRVVMNWIGNLGSRD